MSFLIELAHFVSRQPADLFTSGNDKDLIFKDSTKKLVEVPLNTDSFLYLGAEYMSIIRSLGKGTVNKSRKTQATRQTPDTVQCSWFRFYSPSRAEHVHIH